MALAFRKVWGVLLELAHFRGAQRKPRGLTADRKHAWSPAEAWGRQGGMARDPHGNASSRFLRRAAPRSPWSPGGALRRGALGPFGIAAMRREAPGLASFQGALRAPRGEGNVMSIRTGADAMMDTMSPDEQHAHLEAELAALAS